MLIFIVLLYFCMACSLLWLALFPSGRAVVLQAVRSLGQNFGQRRAHVQRGAGGIGAALLQTERRTLKFLMRHWPYVAGGVAVVLIPSVIALWVSGPAMLPSFEEREWVPDPHIAALLKGEQLAPPMALPPLAFNTQEVELIRPMLVSASRNWEQLNPDFSQRLLIAFKIMKEQHGYDMALLEGYRSPERQNLLAGIGSNVTNARAFQSYHQYGLAADCAFWRDGKLVISEKDPWAMRGYQLYGQVAESLGLTWGGRWAMMDFGHTELRLKGVIRK